MLYVICVYVSLCYVCLSVCLCFWNHFMGIKDLYNWKWMRVTCLISRVSDSRQCKDVGLPRVQLSDDVHTNLLHRRIQVHHLVRYTQLVNEFLHTKWFSAGLRLFETQWQSYCEEHLSSAEENTMIQWFDNVVKAPSPWNKSLQQYRRFQYGCLSWHYRVTMKTS